MGGFGGRGGFIPRGTFYNRGGFGGAFGNHLGAIGGGQRGGRNFSQDLYAEYNGPDAAVPGAAEGFDGSMVGVPAGPAVVSVDLEPSTQIMVRNVSEINFRNVNQ